MVKLVNVEVCLSCSYIIIWLFYVYKKNGFCKNERISGEEDCVFVEYFGRNTRNETKERNLETKCVCCFIFDVG